MGSRATTNGYLHRNITLCTSRPVTHVLLDLDGLLIDSEDKYTEAFDTVAKRYGKSMTPELKRKVICTSADYSSKTIVGELELPITPEEFRHQFSQLLPKLFATCKLMPGAERLLNHLKSHAIPMAVASGSPRDAFLQKIGHITEFSNWFHHVVTARGDPEIIEHKPAPDTFLVCKDRFSPPPEAKDCLVLEDSVAGVLAGCRAGMQVVWIPDHSLFDMDVLKNNNELKPVQILGSLEDFKPEDFGLPPFPEDSLPN